MKMDDDKPKLFTPFVRGNSRLRAYLLIPASDMEKFDALPKVDDGQTVDVFDTVSQAIYRASRADCGSKQCFCAAQIVGQLTGTFGMEGTDA
jgi:hypothetical protein